MHTNKWSKTKWNKTKQNKNKAKQSKTKNQIFFLNLPRPHHSIYLLYHKCHLAQEREKGHRGSWWHWERKSFNWVLCKSTCLYVGYSYIHPEYFYGNFSACFCEIPHPSDSVAISHCFFFFHNFWFMSGRWRSCPSMSKQPLPGVFTANPFPKKQSGVSTARNFRKWKFTPWNMQGSVCVCVCVQGKPFTLSGLPSFETPEANLCGQFLKSF